MAITTARQRGADVGAKAARVSFPDLDSLRTIACAMVIYQHVFSATAMRLVPYPLVHRVFGMLPGPGGLGVSFFFVLSGFLITYLLLTEQRTTGSVDVKAFYQRRILRIWPLYYLLLLLMLFICPAAKRLLGISLDIEAAHPAWYLLFLSNYATIMLGEGHGAMAVNITWSVAIEEQFYVVWPLVFRLLPRSLYKWVFPTIIVGSTVFRLLHWHEPMVLYFHTMSVISDMALGGLCAYCALSRPGFIVGLQRLTSPQIALVYVGGATIALCLGALAHGPAVGLCRLLPTAFFAFVIVEQCFAAKSPIKLRNVKVLYRLGKYTYGLYVLHPLAMLAHTMTLQWLRMSSQSLGVALCVALSTAGLSVALAYVSYRFYERPFLGMKQRFARVPSGG